MEIPHLNAVVIIVKKNKKNKQKSYSMFFPKGLFMIYKHEVIFRLQYRYRNIILKCVVSRKINDQHSNLSEKRV